MSASDQETLAASQSMLAIQRGVGEGRTSPEDGFAAMCYTLDEYLDGAGLSHVPSSYLSAAVALRERAFPGVPLPDSLPHVSDAPGLSDNVSFRTMAVLTFLTGSWRDAHSAYRVGARDIGRYLDDSGQVAGGVIE